MAKYARNVVSFTKLREYRDEVKPRKPKRSKAQRMAENNGVAGRFPCGAVDNIAKVGMR